MKNLTSFARNLNRARSAKVSLLIAAFVVVTGFSMISCDSGGGGGGGGGNSSNSYVGTWVGYENDGDRVTVEVKNTTWTVRMDNGESYSGTYTYNGNTARWIHSDGTVFGTATLSGNRLTLEDYPGGLILTKQ